MSATASSSTGEHNRRAKRGVKLMMLRQVLTQLLTFAGGVALARLLMPADFGLFVVSFFYVETLILLGGLGVRGHLVQRRQDLAESDLRAGFTLQLLTAVPLAAVAWFAAPHFIRLYPDVDAATGAAMLRSLTPILFVAPLRGTSVLRLERAMKFGQSAAVDLVEALIFQAVAVACAFAGLGVWSFAAALLARAGAGAATAYGLSRWPVRLGLAGVASLVRLSLGYWTRGLVASVGGWTNALGVGLTLGPAAVGFVTWSSSNGRKPTQAINLLSRVSFPHLARLQDDPDAMRSALMKYTTPLLLLAAAWSAMILVAGRDLVAFVYGEKWLPAYVALAIYSLAVLLDVLLWAPTQALLAAGRAGYLAWNQAVRTVVFFGGTLALVGPLGFNAAPVAYAASVIATLPMVVWRSPVRVTPMLLDGLWRAAAPLLAAVGVAAGVRAGLATDRELLEFATVTVAGGVAFVVVATLALPAWMRLAASRNLRRLLPTPRAPLGVARR